MPPPAPPPPARPGQAFTIAALLGRSSPPPAPPPPPTPSLPPLPHWGAPPGPLCAACCGPPPAWAARLGATGRAGAAGSSGGKTSPMGRSLKGDLLPPPPAPGSRVRISHKNASTGGLFPSFQEGSGCFTPLSTGDFIPPLQQGLLTASPIGTSSNGDLLLPHSTFVQLPPKGTQLQLGSPFSRGSLL